jgi:hypothetical protein
MQIPTGVIGIITLLAGIFLTNRFKIRWPILACLCLPCIAGAAGLIHVSRSNLRGLMATYYITWFLAGIRESKVPAGSHRKVSHKCIEPLLFAWANLNAAGTTKRVVTKIVGPQLYFSWEAPTYHTGLYCDIAAWSLLCVLCVAMGFHLRHLNAKQAKRRVALGLPIDMLDMSFMSLEEASAYKVALSQQLLEQGFDEARLYDHSFDDMTDFE